jgi:hypothetical protein
MAMRNVFRKNISWPHWTYAIKTGKLEYFYNSKGLHMKRNDLKYLLDSLLFVNISSIAAIGLLLAFFIPAGKRPHAEKYFLGLHRHDWGDFHLYLSLSLLVLLVLHIWLNWTWVVQSTKRYFANRWKKYLWGLSCAWFVVLLFGWVMMKH